MDTLTTLFRTSMRWNTAGAIGYQSLLLAHQAALYKLMSSTQYGAMSVLLSFIYLGAVIADGGLDATLSTFFGELTRERFTFKKFLLPHWASVFFVATILALIFGLVHERFFTTVPLSPLVIVSASLILIAESFRRSLRMTLQLAFKAKMVTLLDIGTMLAYLIFIWGSYFSGTLSSGTLSSGTLSSGTLFSGALSSETPLGDSPLSLELLMGALAFCSVICSLMMAILVGIWQRKLSDTESAQKSDHEVLQNTHLKMGSLQKRLIVSRLINGGNILTHQLFSGNVLVPLVSMSSGLGDAGLIKLASYIAHGLVTIVRKIVGFSGAALLSALKNASWTTKRPAFWELSRTLYATLFFSIIAMTSMSSHLVAQEVISNEQSSILLLVILLIVSEGLCISYETLFIIEEKTLYAIALNGTTGLVAGLLILGAPTLSLITLLSLILCVRLALFGAMVFVASHLWQLYPSLPSVSGKFLTRTSLLAGLAYLCGSPLALLLAR